MPSNRGLKFEKNVIQRNRTILIFALKSKINGFKKNSDRREICGVKIKIQKKVILAFDMHMISKLYFKR